MTTETLEPPTQAVQESRIQKAKRLQATQAVQSTAPSDSVTLAGSALILQKLEQTLSTLTVVDQKRVENIKAAIAKGQYVVDPKKTADKFMRLESALRTRS